VSSGDVMEPIIQLDMFRETTAEDVLRAELVALRESHHAVRKKLFSQVGGLTKMVMEQQNEIDYLKIKLGLACAYEVKIMEVINEKT
jgi:hypothetical protein